MASIANWPQMQIGIGILGCTASGTAVAGSPNDATQIPIFTEIGSRCRYIETTRGKNYELDAARGALNHWIFDNRDGILDPNNTSSIYYPGITTHKMVRWSTVRNPTSNLLEPNIATAGDVYGAGSVFQVMQQTGTTLNTVTSSGTTVPLQGSVMLSSAYANAAASGTRGWAFGNGYLTPGSTYTFSCYANIPTTTLGCALTIKCYNSAATQLSTVTGSTVTVNSTWQRLTVTFTVPANTIATVFYIASTAIAGSALTLCTDQLQLELGSSATTWTAPGATNVQATNFVQSLITSYDRVTYQQLLTMTTQDALGILSQQLLLNVHGNEVQLINPYLYLPLGDDGKSGMAGALMNPTTGIQQSPGVLQTFGAGNKVTFGGTSIVAGDPNGGSLTFDNTAVPSVSWTQLTLPVLINSATTGAVSVNFWINTTQVPSVAGDIVAQTQNSNGDDWTVATQNNGKVRFSVTYNGTLFDQIDSTNALNDGKSHMITAIIYSSQARMQFYVDGTLQGDIARTASRATGQNISSTRIGNGASSQYPYVGSIQHFDIFNYQLSSTQVSNLFNSGSNGWTGDVTAVRFNRILGYSNTTIHGVVPSDGGVQTETGLFDSAGSSVLDALALVVQDEQSNMYNRGDGFLGLESRHQRWKVLTPNWTIGDNGTTEIPYMDSVETEVDDLKVVNYVQANRIGGATQSATDLTSVNNHFYRSYPSSLTLKTISDADATAILQGIVWRYKNPQERLVAAEFHPAAIGSALGWSFACSADVSHRILYNRRPRGATAKALDLWIESIVHKVTITESSCDWQTDIEASPGLPGNATPGLTAQMFFLTALRTTLKTSTIAGATSFTLNAMADAATNTSQANGWTPSAVTKITIWDGASTETLTVSTIATTVTGYTQFIITTTTGALFGHSSNVVISEFTQANGSTWSYNTFDTNAALDSTNILGY
jgi:hypothetical protein